MGNHQSGRRRLLEEEINRARVQRVQGQIRRSLSLPQNQTQATERRSPNDTQNDSATSPSSSTAGQGPSSESQVSTLAGRFDLDEDSETTMNRILLRSLMRHIDLIDLIESSFQIAIDETFDSQSSFASSNDSLTDTESEDESDDNNNHLQTLSRSSSVDTYEGISALFSEDPVSHSDPKKLEIRKQVENLAKFRENITQLLEKEMMELDTKIDDAIKVQKKLAELLHQEKSSRHTQDREMLREKINAIKKADDYINHESILELIGKVRSLQEDTSTLNQLTRVESDVVTCTVCLAKANELVGVALLSCVSCDALVCQHCKRRIKNHCPVCRTGGWGRPNSSKQPRRNRWAEKLAQHQAAKMSLD